jgi:hypothetical protein
MAVTRLGKRKRDAQQTPPQRVLRIPITSLAGDTSMIQVPLATPISNHQLKIEVSQVTGNNVQSIDSVQINTGEEILNNPNKHTYTGNETISYSIAADPIIFSGGESDAYKRLIMQIGEKKKKYHSSIKERLKDTRAFKEGKLTPEAQERLAIIRSKVCHLNSIYKNTIRVLGQGVEVYPFRGELSDHSLARTKLGRSKQIGVLKLKMDPCSNKEKLFLTFNYKTENKKEIKLDNVVGCTIYNKDEYKNILTLRTKDNSCFHLMLDTRKSASIFAYRLFSRAGLKHKWFSDQLFN